MRSGVEETELRLGFVGLSDCAPLVVAKERGFFRKHGLRVTLERQSSWASVRDKLVAGWLDAAQMLAPMPLAMSLGIDGPTLPVSAPMALGLNGNGITVSRRLHQRMGELDPEAMAERPITASALRTLLRTDRLRRPLRFAAVFPFSSHHYELRYWMAAAGIDPSRELEICILPPAAMPARLARGDIDGYCVGEPWNQLAVADGTGRCLVTKHEIWNHSPEKVLALREDWCDRHPATVRALVRALIEAAAWADRPANRLETAHLITGESRVDAPTEVTTAALAEGEGGLHVFHRFAATFPWVSHGTWFLTQMLRWGQVEKPIAIRDEAARVYRPDLYREAAEELGEPFPEIDEKSEGLHATGWCLDDASMSIAMGSDRFLDGRVFDPGDPVAYLEQFAISAMRVRTDDLALVNPVS